jgi:hypothetical protein
MANRGHSPARAISRRPETGNVVPDDNSHSMLGVLPAGRVIDTVAWTIFDEIVLEALAN